MPIILYRSRRHTLRSGLAKHYYHIQQLLGDATKGENKNLPKVETKGSITEIRKAISEIRKVLRQIENLH